MSDENPYQSPSGVTDHEPGARRLVARAVILGWLVDVAGSLAAGLAISLLGLVVFTVRGNSLEEAQQAVSASIVIHACGLLVGFCLTIAGGYVAAWIAGQVELRHAACVGILSTALGVLLILTVRQGPPLWIRMLGLAVPIPAATFGGYLRMLVARRVKS